MAFPTSVNDQITDAVTQANVKELGDGPTQAIGDVLKEMTRSEGELFENAVQGQQEQSILGDAVEEPCRQKGEE